MASKTSIYENLIYASIWIAAFVFSFTVVGDDILNGDSSKWSFVLKAVMSMIPFMASFVIHAYILVPLLLDKRKHILYVIALVVLVTVFTINAEKETQKKREQWHQAMVELYKNESTTPPPPPFLSQELPPMSKAKKIQFEVKKFFGSPTFLDVVLLLLLLSANLGVRYCFSKYEHEKHLRTMEQEVTKAELESLKSQISPHFIMNVLNNIHGLIEIDSQRAQDMVLELSKMMRYVLYECSSAQIYLHKEVAFINNYVLLMKERYPAGKLEINLNLPDMKSCQDYKISPLVFVVFIENAFKHGIDFSDLKCKSIIDITLELREEELHFVCRNPNVSKPEGVKASGIGLKNIRRRLDVIYQKDYHLNIDNVSNIYSVDLTLPLNYDYKMSGNR